MRLRMALAALVLAAVACVSEPAAPAAGRSTAWGYVRLVPREGVEPGGAGAYADRRLRDARLVDYSRPGFAVVWADAADANDAADAAAPLRVEIRGSAATTRFAPARAALAAGGVLVVTNASPDPHVLSFPTAGVVRPLAPGEAAELRVSEPGRHEVFLLDAREAAATVFAAPGAFAVVAGDGRFELPDLAPGVRVLHAWHPRFPPAERRVELPSGRATRVDLELGVERLHAGDGVEGR